MGTQPAPSPMHESALPASRPRNEAQRRGVAGRARRWSSESAGASSCGREPGGRAALQTVPAQGHLALAEVSAGTQPVVLGAGACTAEEQGLLLQEALAAGLGEGRVQVVHLRLGAVTGHLQPGWAPWAAVTATAWGRPLPSLAHPIPKQRRSF